VTLGGVPDGPHTYAATATDAASNTSPSSNTRTVITDTAAPTVVQVNRAANTANPTKPPALAGT
jgi:large repetitive protein